MSDEVSQFYDAFDRLIRRAAPAVQRVTLFGPSDAVLWDTTGMVGPDEVAALGLARDSEPLPLWDAQVGNWATGPDEQRYLLVPIGDGRGARMVLLQIDDRSGGSDTSAVRTLLHAIEPAVQCLIAFETRPPTLPSAERIATREGAPDFARELCRSVLEPSPPRRVFRLVTAVIRAVRGHAAFIAIPDYGDVLPLIREPALGTGGPRGLEEWIRTVSRAAGPSDVVRITDGRELAGLAPPAAVGGLLRVSLSALPGDAAGVIAVALRDASLARAVEPELMALAFVVCAVYAEERDGESGALRLAPTLERTRAALRGPASRGGGMLIAIAPHWRTQQAHGPRAAIASRLARFLRRVLPPNAILGRLPAGPFVAFVSHATQADPRALVTHMLVQARARKARSDVTKIPAFSLGYCPVTGEADIGRAVAGATRAALAAAAGAGGRGRPADRTMSPRAFTSTG